MKKVYKHFYPILGKTTASWMAVLLLMAFTAGCDNSSGSSSSSKKQSVDPTVISTIPISDAIDVSLNRDITVNFSKELVPEAFTTETATLTGPDLTPVVGTLSSQGSIGVFNPNSDLAANSLYTATITNSAGDKYVWTFTTGITIASGPEPVNLGTSGDFVILSKTGITTTGTTAIVGDVGVSPIAETAMTGFSQTRDASNQFSTAGIVTGKMYAADMANPTPAKMITAISDMETAYLDAKGRVLPDFTEHGAGNISGMTLVPGLYKWGTGVLITSDVTLAGGAHDVWIFQIAQDLTVSSGVTITLSGGALSQNVFWQVAGQVPLGTTADFKGIILSKTLISMATGAVLNGKALSQTAVTLNANAVNQPAAPIDTTMPTVSQTSPTNNATAISINQAITVTFTEPMATETVSPSTFILKQGTTAVSGTVTIIGTTATFTPLSPLAFSTSYTATLTTGAQDAAGNALAENYSWSFTTGDAPDITAPTVSQTSPANNATAISINGAISATFSEAMEIGTLSTATFTLRQDTTAISGTFSYSDFTATLTPLSPLAFSTSYTATITTGAKDVAGNVLLQDTSWSFTTAVEPDIMAPIVSQTSPANNVTAVLVNGVISATFNETMDSGTLDTASFTLRQGTTAISGTISTSSAKATFTPLSNLAFSTIYTASITTDAKDAAGNALANAFVWNFETVADVALGQAAVNLGTAGNFVILAKTGISTTGTTAIVGDIGVSPAAETFITGFSQTHDSLNQFATAAIVTGKIYASDMANPTPANMTTAISDMQIAYADAAGRTLPDFAEHGSGNISGMTLVPGLYKWGTGVLITSDVTISGGTNAVWIFQIAQNLTVESGVKMTLSGGALPKNIFWQVAGQVILGTTADFKGILLSQTQIAMGTGTVLNGRALTQTAVTLDANAVIQPSGSFFDTTAPTVSQTSPANNATAVSVNGAISAIFNETMATGTLSTSTFSLKQGTTSVSGTVSTIGTTATFTPSSALEFSTSYTVTITTGAKDVVGNVLAQDYSWSFTTGVAPDTTAPTVSQTSPANTATEVSVNGAISATFNETMATGTLSTSTFTLMQGTTAVSGTVNTIDTITTFTPSSVLAFNTDYTVTITTGAKDIAGNALAQDTSWSFTTGAEPDTTAPTVSQTFPNHNATEVPINEAITATFNETMETETLSTATVTLKQGFTVVSGTVSTIGITTTFKPLSPLIASTAYTVTITTGVKDVAGNAMAQNYSWSFTTGTASDTITPTVSQTYPVDTDTGISTNRKISATFNETMDPGTLLTSTFTLKQDTTAVSGTVTYIGTTATFTPLSNLEFSKLYTATLTTGAKDLTGNALANDFVWTFTTGTELALGPLPVNLRTAGSFVILSKAGVSTTGTTAIVGNVGVSPAAETYLTGFSQARDASNQFSIAGIVTGKLYAANMAVPTPANMTTAISDMETAYIDAAGRSLPDFTELGAGDISGLTLVPGLYKWGTGMLIATDVELSGGVNDVWIFQIAQDLTVNNGVKVTLSGGALPKNIFWQVAGKVSLGTTADFKGVLLSKTKIVMETGAVINGRALAQTAVTLDANAVTQPVN
ncbi:ice-binding family protein [Deltaproteobacteria bacterium TL4]